MSLEGGWPFWSGHVVLEEGITGSCTRGYEVEIRHRKITDKSYAYDGA